MILPTIAADANRDRRAIVMSADFPEWAARQLLAEALRAAGLPVVAGAMWRAPRVVLTLEERLQAIDAEARVLDEARRRLPWDVSGAALAGEFREMAWRCAVAALAPMARDRGRPARLRHQLAEVVSDAA